VGGLADWFASGAVRHPLGLPIPHTAIVATRKEHIGGSSATSWQITSCRATSSRPYLRAVTPAERAARWLADPENSRRIARQIAAGLAKTIEALPDEEARALVHDVVSARLRATRVAPALGKTLALVLADERTSGAAQRGRPLAAVSGAGQPGRDPGQGAGRGPWWPGVVDDQIFQGIIGTVESCCATSGWIRFIPLRAPSIPPCATSSTACSTTPDVIAKARQ